MATLMAFNDFRFLVPYGSYTVVVFCNFFFVLHYKVTALNAVTL